MPGDWWCIDDNDDDDDDDDDDGVENPILLCVGVGAVWCLPVSEDSASPIALPNFAL